MDWKAFLTDRGKQSKLLAFERARFNVPFAAAAGTYYHIGDIKDFIEMTTDDNKLLRALQASISEEFLCAEIRALGIMWHKIMDPYMTLVTSKGKKILDLNPYFSSMMVKLEQYMNSPQDLLDPDEKLWDDVHVQDTDVTKSLYTSHSDLISVTLEALSLICGKFLGTLQRQLADQLPGGKFDQPSEALQSQSSTVVLNNIRGESDFAVLKRQKIFAPNATTLCHETVTMWEQNRPGDYLQKLSPAEYHQHMAISQKLGPHVIKQERERAKALEEKRRETLKQKQLENAQKEKAKADERQELVNKICDMGGPLNHPEEIAQSMANKTEIEKLAILQEQLRYQRLIINKPGVDRKLYYFSKNGSKYSSDELTSHLATVLEIGRAHV
jgi:hypothetical protein